MLTPNSFVTLACCIPFLLPVLLIATSCPLLSALENIGAPPELFDAKLARLLPWLILVAQEHNLRTHSGVDALEGSGLVLRAGASSAVAVTRVRPARFQDVHGLAVADTVEDVNLALDEATGLVSSHGGVEEGVQVGTDDVNNA